MKEKKKKYFVRTGREKQKQKYRHTLVYLITRWKKGGLEGLDIRFDSILAF